MKSTAKIVDEYMAEVPEDRKEALEKLRNTIQGLYDWFIDAVTMQNGKNRMSEKVASGSKKVEIFHMT